MALVATWWHDGVGPVVPDVAYSCNNENGDQLWFVFKRRYYAHDHYFETGLRMRYSLLVGSQNFEICSILPADRSGFYPILPSRWCEYE